MYENEGKEKYSCERSYHSVLWTTRQKEGYPIGAKVMGDVHCLRLGYYFVIRNNITVRDYYNYK